MKINRKIIEDAIGKKLREGICLGLDPASRTGWCLIEVKNKDILIEYGFIHIDSTDIFFKYNKLIEAIDGLIKNIWNKKYKDEDKLIVIEDIYFGRNVHTFKMLARIGMIAYTIATLNNMPKTFALATQARISLGFKGNANKETIQKQFLAKTKLKVTDDDIVDAIILAIHGLIKPPNNLPI